MKITINKKGLVPDDTWQFFRKVRAVIENEEGKVAISIEGGKCIFPGGKCEKDEAESIAISREIEEETGIHFDYSDFEKVLELETIYDDYLDFRTQSIRPKHTITTYYYVKTKDDINKQNMHLTDDEIKQKFNCFFADKENLFKLLKEDHSHLENGKFFDEENDIIMNKILNKRLKTKKLT